MTNFDHTLLLSWPFVGKGAYFTNGKILSGADKCIGTADFPPEM